MSATLGMGPDLHTLLRINALTIFEVYVILTSTLTERILLMLRSIYRQGKSARREGRSERHLNNRIFVILDTKRHPK